MAQVQQQMEGNTVFYHVCPSALPKKNSIQFFNSIHTEQYNFILFIYVIKYFTESFMFSFNYSW